MGKTFLSLFSEFKKEQLCQLYIHPTIPDLDICSSYFQITDKQIISAGWFGKAGDEISADSIAKLIEQQKNGQVTMSASWQGISPHKCLIRDLVWKMSKWYSKKLRQWLDRESPSVIFVAPGYAKFLYDIALKISKDRNIPIVTYICDDYYFVTPSASLLGKIYLARLQKKMDQLMDKTSKLVAISEEIANAYNNRFGVPVQVIMTGAEKSLFTEYNEKNGIKNICYFGNLNLGRNKTLSEIGKVIDEINDLHAKNIVLNIYTSERDESLLLPFRDIRCLTMGGFVSGQSFKKAFLSSDMLVHVESFLPENIDIVKHSISTKVADSLASGIPVLAYAPENISSMQHLIRNQCALVATSVDELKRVLENAILNGEELLCITNNAKNTAEKYHDRQKNSAKLLSIITEFEEKKQ